MNNGFVLDPELSFRPAEEIRALQERLLRQHLCHAAEHSPFYRELLAGKIGPEFRLEELGSLPTTSKDDLARCNDDFLACRREEAADVSFTSGTTGRPCRIVYTGNDLDRLALNDASGYFKAGIRPGDRVLLTCTIDRCFIAGLAYYMGARKLGAAGVRNGLNTLDSHAELIEMVHPEAVVGVPSFLAKLGAFLRENRVDASCVRTLICIGEPLRDRDLNLTPLGRKLDALWEGKIFSTYASSEIATSFTECEAQCGGHPPAELAIVEIVDDAGRPLPPGETGEVVVTPLQVTGMPLVRFRTGDVSFLVPGRCSCGRNSVRLGPILGRKAQMMKIRGTTLFPSSFGSVLDGMDEVLDYFMELSGCALSDQLAISVALRDGAELETVAARLYARTRLHVEVRRIDAETARSRIFGSSRKPVRFFDLREA